MKANTVKTIKAHFILEKETKGALRYAERDANGAEMDSYPIGTLYIRKSAFSNGQYPKKLYVEINHE